MPVRVLKFFLNRDEAPASNDGRNAVSMAEDLEEAVRPATAVPLGPAALSTPRLNQGRHPTAATAS